MKLDIETPGYVIPLTQSGTVAATGAPIYTPAASQSDLAGTSTNITAQNANQSTGTATAGSTVAASGNGKATASVQITANTLNVALLAQGSLDGVTWFNLGPLAFLNQNTGVYSSSIPAAATGVWTVAVADFPFFRVTTPNSAVTGSATVLVNMSATQAIVTSEPIKYNVARATADALAKTGVGVIHTVTVSSTQATPVAGLLTIYDNTAESGTAVYSEWVTAGVLPHTVTLDEPVANGIYIGYDATLTGVNVNVSYL